MSGEESDAAAKRRAAMIEDHQKFLRSIATSRTLTHQQSSIAGFGGSTLQEIRDAQNRERVRLEAMAARRAAEEATAKAQAELHAKADALSADAAKRKAKRDKKKKATKGPSGSAAAPSLGSDATMTASAAGDDAASDDDDAD